MIQYYGLAVRLNPVIKTPWSRFGGQVIELTTKVPLVYVYNGLALIPIERGPKLKVA